MSEPSGALRQLAAEGRQLRAQYLASMEARRSQPSRVALGVDVVDLFFDLTGYKRTAKRVGKVLAHQSSTAQDTKFVAQFESWANRVRQNLSGMTLIGRRVPPRSNSAVLSRRFTRTLAYARIDTKLAHAIPFLEGLAEERLVRNEDIVALRAPAPKQERPRTPEATAKDLTMAEGDQVVNVLARFPEEQQAILGALTVYRSRTPDYGRQSLGSSRNALENLVKRLSGDGDWSAGLVKLVPSETKRRTFRQVHSFLSGVGTHGPGQPSEADVIMGLRLTFTAIRALIGDGGARA